MILNLCLLLLQYDKKLEKTELGRNSLIKTRFSETQCSILKLKTMCCNHKLCLRPTGL